MLQKTLTLALILSLSACAENAPPPSPHNLQISTAPLELPGIAFACYDLLVENGATTPETVVRRGVVGQSLADGDTETLCSTRFGNGPGGALSYVAPCDASEPSHTVTLWVDGLYEGTPSDPVLVDYQDPCPSGCALTAHCAENADTPVSFNLTIMRPANQGFFDVAVNFQNIFCSAKVDCEYGPGEPITLLHNPANGQRGQTVVLGLACSAGPGDDIETVLFRDPITITCAGMDPIVLDPTLGEGNVYGPIIPDPDLTDPVWQYATYFGDEALPCGNTSCNKRYWNVAIGFDPSAHGCTLTTAATAAPGDAMPDFSTPEAATWPIINIAIDLTGQSGGLECSSHPLNGDDSGVSTSYTPITIGAVLCHRFDGSGFATGDSEHCNGLDCDFEVLDWYYRVGGTTLPMDGIDVLLISDGDGGETTNVPPECCAALGGGTYQVAQAHFLCLSPNPCPDGTWTYEGDLTIEAEADVPDNYECIEVIEGTLIIRDDAPDLSFTSLQEITGGVNDGLVVFETGMSGARTFEFPVLTTIGGRFIFNANGNTSMAVDALTTVTGIMMVNGNSGSIDLTFPALTGLDDLSVASNTGNLSLDMPVITSVANVLFFSGNSGTMSFNAANLQSATAIGVQSHTGPVLLGLGNLSTLSLSISFVNNTAMTAAGLDLSSLSTSPNALLQNNPALSTCYLRALVDGISPPPVSTISGNLNDTPCLLSIDPSGITTSFANLSPPDPEADVANLVDGDYQTAFNFGGAPPAWFLVDLGAVYSLDRVELRVSQSPYGITHHEVEAGLTADAMTVVGTAIQHTETHDLLELGLGGRHARFIRVYTVSSPSWVAWTEIEVFGDPLTGPTNACGTLGACPSGFTCMNASYCGNFAGEVAVPGGDFWQGCNPTLDASCGAADNENPAHRVPVAAFAMDRTPVTAAAYAACVNANACSAPMSEGQLGGDQAQVTYGVAGKEDHPVNYVTANQSAAYCAWAGKRLCTESEWEKAARGGCDTVTAPCMDGMRLYPWGSAAPTGCDYANWSGCAASPGATSPVTATPLGASPYGALDMAGNVFERVAQGYFSYPGSASPFSSPDLYVIRGGDHGVGAYWLRTSVRVGGSGTTSTDDIGFRCCRDL